MKFLTHITTLLAISSVILLSSCKNSTPQTNGTPVPEECIKSGIPQTAELRAENGEISVYLNVEGEENDLEKVSVWVWDKKIKAAERVLLSHPSSHGTNGYEEVSYWQKDSIPTVQNVRITPYDIPYKLVVECCVDMRNVWTYIVSPKDSTAILLPTASGLIGFTKEEGLIVTESYEYYKNGGRYGRIDIYSTGGKKLSTTTAKLLPDKGID